MRDLRLDFRYALRSLRAAPVSTLSAIATLALGVGMTTSIFSVVNGIVLRPLPFRDESRLVTLCEQYPGATPDWCSISPPNIEDIAARSRSIEAIGIGRQWPYHLATPTGAEPIEAGLATPGLFRALGVRAERGRLIEDADLIGTESTVILVTHEAWQTRFGGRADIVGQVLSIDKQLVTIVGVLEPGFELPRVGKLDYWRPLHINPRDEQNREWRGFVSFARLRPDVSMDAARRELAGLTAQLRSEHFATTQGWGISMIGTRDLVIGGARPMLYLFLGAVSIVLLIGCANVANLLLARATARAREMAMRSALGASPGRIIRGLLVESVILALAGGAAGVGLAVAATQAFKSLAPPEIPRVDQVSIDARVLMFALVLSLGTTLLFGLAPAVRAAHVNLSQALREGGRGAGGRRARSTAVLVAVELALAVTLVASAGLLTRSFLVLTSWNPGFERDHLLTFTIFAPSTKYPFGAPVAALWRRTEGELGSIPGVVSVATASGGPLFGGRETSEMEFQRVTGEARASVRYLDANPAYFTTFGIPIVRGRALAETDGANDPLVGVVNETLARRFWPGDDPLGKTLTMTVGTDRAVFRVVGVSRDIPALRPDEAIEPQLVWSNRQQPRPFTYFIVRAAVPPATLGPAIRSRMASIDADLRPGSEATLPERMNKQLTTPRFTMLLVAAFGLAALLFAAIGTYGLLSYTSSQRTREIGIRLALGAQRRQILGSVLGSGLAIAAVGVAAGLVATLAMASVMRTLVVGVSVLDPLTLAASALILLIVAAAACFVPAWRASRVDPVRALASD